MGLREGLVEAMAHEVLQWGIKPEKLPAGEKYLAGRLVDAAVGYLTEHADEWSREAYRFHSVNPVVKRLLAVLEADE